jgi:hypothetical protein
LAAVRPNMRRIEITSLKLLILVMTWASWSVSVTSIVTLISAVWLGKVRILAAETLVLASPKIVLMSISNPCRFTVTI